ncbi:MAG: hypothetical protein J5806_14685 [Lentisphaeria bacterium]|nr:hypothetical protein [Lentisphaeria bacterium]
MKVAKTLIGVCTSAMLLTGCMTEEPIQQRVADDRIQLIENNSFNIELLNAKTLINDEGLLTVDVSALLSRTSGLRWIFCGDPKITVWYHFDWIDADGNICPPVQHEMSALPGNIVDFHGVAPDEKYINYRLTISLKGPGTEQEAASQQEAVKKQAAAEGKVKPAGKSQAKKIKKSQAKSKAKPAAKKNAKPAAQKDAPAKQEAKPAVKDTKPAPKADENQQKLTEPFN